MNGFFSIDNRLWRLVRKILDLVWLNLLWLLCALPLVTAGPATTALFYVCFRMQKNEEGYLTRDFFHAFRSNCRQGILLWLILSSLGILLCADLILYFRSTSDTIFHWLLMAAALSCFFLYLMENFYAYGLLARFDNSVKNTLKNSFIMAVTHLPSSILMICLPIVVAALALLVFPPLLLIGVSGTVFVHCWFLERIFKNYI